MGYAIGYDENWERDIGYAVPSVCDHPECNEVIDRGLGYVCCGEPYGGELGCGLFFCDSHQRTQVVGVWGEGDDHDGFNVCSECFHGRDPFEPKPDTREWMNHKLMDYSWLTWRKENPDKVHKIQIALWGS